MAFRVAPRGYSGEVSLPLQCRQAKWTPQPAQAGLVATSPSVQRRPPAPMQFVAHILSALGIQVMTSVIPKTTQKSRRMT